MEELGIYTRICKDSKQLRTGYMFVDKKDMLKISADRLEIF